MDFQNYITVKPERKKGEHLGLKDRGAIRVRPGSNRGKAPGCQQNGLPKTPLSE